MMNNWLQNNKIVFLISVAISVALWWSISYTPSLSLTKEKEYSIKIQDVKVRAMYNEEEFQLSQKTDKIDLTLIGNKFIIDNLPTSSYRVFINLRGLGSGKHRNVPIQVEGLPISIQKEIYPSTVDIELEKKGQKEVPVQIDLIGSVADGYQIEPTVIKPDKVVVRGTESELAKVTLVKAAVNVEGAKESIEKTVKVDIYGLEEPVNGVSVTPRTVDVTIPIQPLSKKVPLSINIKKGPPHGFMVGRIQLNQDSILVYGPKSFLDQLLIYEGNKLDLSKVTSTTTFRLPIIRHNKASKIDPENVSVTVEVVPIG